VSRIACLTLGVLLIGCTRTSEETIAHGRFPHVIVTRPAKAPERVVLLLTDVDGWSTSAKGIARRLADEGALVIGVPLPEFYAELQKEIGGCDYTDGDLENLSHFVQAYYRLAGYSAPILVGYGEGAAFAYANFAQAPQGTFGGAVSAEFKPHLRLRQELCAGEKLVTHKTGDGFDLTLPSSPSPDWLRLPAGADASAIAQAVRKLADAHPAARSTLPEELSDLPIVEMPAAEAKPGAPIAIFWSGDGGWAGLDEEVADALVQRGVAVAGFDSLRYFWSERTPEKLAADVGRAVRHYSARWHSDRVLLIGFSQGADVLPFAMTRLPADVRPKIALFVAMSLARHAGFEFHLGNWIAAVKEGYDTLPEVQKIRGTPVLCIYGEEDEDSVCPELEGKGPQVVKLPGSHHFNGDYERLADEILKAARN
jgi:type IV secretory pathway VirJ component